MDTSSSSSSVPIMSSRDIHSHQEGLIGGERSGLATIAISGGGQDKITASGASLWMRVVAALDGALLPVWVARAVGGSSLCVWVGQDTISSAIGTSGGGDRPMTACGAS